ncbi:MAG: iron ABC transporter substrate-binding protein [Actinobacteria bacterium]|nr:iron ABC transporter substrate-binding protein [Actinomycetota bacterium]
MRRSRPVAVALALALGAGALTACESGGGRRVTIYSGRTEELIAPLLERFAQESGISVDVRYGDSADLALLLNEEGDKSPADVFLSQSPGAMGYVDGSDLLRELPDEILDQIDARFRAGDGDWVGVSGRVRVLVYNREKVDLGTLPDSVFDLTQGRYRGKVGIAPTNASFIDFVTAMREIEGDERTLAWLEGLKANDAQEYANNIAIVEAVGRGEIDLGLVNHYYNEQAKAEDPGIASENFVFPNGDIGAVILVTAAGVLRTSARTDEAEQLVDFLLSKEAQEYFAEQTFEYPLAAGVEPTVEDLPPLADIAGPSVELSSLGNELAKTRELIQQAGFEA